MPRKRKPARLYWRKDEQTWIILDGGKQIRTGFGHGFRDQAEAALSRYISQKTLQDRGTVELDEISVGEVLVRYADHKRQKVKDPERLLYTVKALAPFWANMTVAEVTDDACRTYVRKRGVSAWTVRREMNTLNAALRLAAARRRIPYAPVVELPPKGIANDRWLSQEEVDRLIQASSPHIRRFILIALHTGRRKTAITRLRWTPSLNSGWVDLDNGVIHFLGKAEEETKKRKGIVRMTKTLFDEMRSWEQDGTHVISFGRQPIKRIDQAFRRAVVRAELEDVTPHTLKHTAVTWAFMKGMTLEMAVDFFATSRETLENVYRSYHPDAQREAVEIMDRSL
jgi:integrase